MSNSDWNGDDKETTKLLQRTKHLRQPKEAPAGRKVAVLLSAVAIQLIINGLIFSLPVFYPELIAAFNSQRSDAVLVQSLFAGLCTGGGLLWSPLLIRFGLGPCSIGSVIMGAVFFGINLVASSLAMVIVTVGVIAGLVMCLCYLTPFVAVSWTFHRDPRAALVVVTVGSSLGQFVLPYLSEIFIQQYQWRGAFLLCGAMATQVIPFAVIIHCSRDYFNTGGATEAASATNKGRESRCPVDLTLFKDVVIAFLLMNCFLLAMTGNLEAWLMVDISVSRGFGREQGSLIVSLIGLAMFVGRGFGITMQYKCRVPSVYHWHWIYLFPLIGVCHAVVINLYDYTAMLATCFVNVPSVYHWIYLFPLIGVCHAVVINLYDYTAMLATCFVNGALFGIATSQTPAIMFEASGLERYPQGMALVNLMYGLGNFLSGLLGGFIRDTYGDYNPMFYFGTAASIFIGGTTVIVSRIMKKRQRAQDQETSVTYTQLSDDV